MSLKASKKVDTNRYELEIVIDGAKFGEAIKEVYKDMPGLLEEVLEWVRKNWKGA